MKTITVLLADDHTVVREGLRALLEMEGGFEVVGEAANGLEAVEQAMELRPAVVVLDLAMPKLNGMEAARRILKQISPPPKVVFLSAHNDDAYVEQVAVVGAKGYLIKQTSAHLLAQAIRDVYAGKPAYSTPVADRMEDFQLTAIGRKNRRNKVGLQLTSREGEVLQLIAEGNSNKEVAADLGISIKTVEKHRQAVMDKLGIHDTSGLTRYAISAGIIESSAQCTILD